MKVLHANGNRQVVEVQRASVDERSSASYLDLTGRTQPNLFIDVHFAHLIKRTTMSLSVKCALLLWILVAITASLTAGQYPINRKQLTLQEAFNLQKRTYT